MLSLKILGGNSLKVKKHVRMRLLSGTFELSMILEMDQHDNVRAYQLVSRCRTDLSNGSAFGNGRRRTDNFYRRSTNWDYWRCIDIWVTVLYSDQTVSSAR